MIGYDATLAERANSAGTGELICLFLLFVLFFCMLTSVCVIISFFLFVYSICVHLFIDQPLASCSVSPSPSACRAQGRHSRMQVSYFIYLFYFLSLCFVLYLYSHSPLLSLSLSLAAMAAATAEVAAVADDEELAGHEWLVGKRLYDGDDSICAQIVSIDTASSRGNKFEEIRATCVRLDSGLNVPECAITATGKVSQAQRFTQLFCTLTLIPLLLN